MSDFRNSPLLRRFTAAIAGVISSCVLSHGQGELALSLQIDSLQQHGQLTWTFHPPERTGSHIQRFFEIQYSSDLNRWLTIDELNVREPDTPTPLLLSHSLRLKSPHGFFRILTGSEPAISYFTADSGEEIFGLQRQFDRELERLGQMSLDTFGALFTPPGTPAQIAYDPTAGEFWDRFNTDIEAYNKSRPPESDPRMWDFRLNDRELTLFRENGFVVSERLGSHSFADLFYRIYTDDLPVYISSDAILQAWHRTFASILMELEATLFYSSLQQLVSAMHRGLPDAWQKFGNGPLRDSLLDADVFLTVAIQLLAGKDLDPGARAPGSHLGQNEFVAKTVQFIRDLAPRPYRNNAAPEQEFNLFDRRTRALPLPIDHYPESLEFFDFSQFKLRGHYDQSTELARYFKTMMWLNRVDFRLAGPEPHASPRELGTAMVLAHLFNQSGQKAAWNQVQRLLVDMVGVNDYMTLDQLDALLAAGGFSDLDQLRSPSDLSRIQDLINQGGLGVQQIRSHPYVGASVKKLPRSCSMGIQAFVIDGWALSQIVYPDVNWNGSPILRFETSALDVAFSVLGNDHTIPWITERIQSPTATRRDGLPYQHNLAAARRAIDRLDDSFWQASIYSSWLGAMRRLTFPYSDLRLPSVMRTRQWQMKTLNTQLASWTHLKHDTLLYAKQPYSGMIICFYPDGYVEPAPDFYAHLERMARRLADTLESLRVDGPFLISSTFANQFVQPLPTQIQALKHFIEVMQQLKQIAVSELAGQQLDASQIGFIRELIESSSVIYVGTKKYSGWYPKLFYKNVFEANKVPDGDLDFQGSDRWDALVTDVQTAPQPPGSVLHQAVGNVHLLLISIETTTGLRVYAGPVLSHYEFYTDGLNRLSDTDWKDQLIQESSPLHSSPEWTRGYLVPIAQ